MAEVYLSLLICTYQRPKAIMTLLYSVGNASLKPDRILIIDGSPGDETRENLSRSEIKDLQIDYYKVPPEQRGLTRQRNFGLEHLPAQTKIVAFLDDDIVVEPDYFEQLINAFKMQPDAIGVGGIDLKENSYFKKEEGAKYSRFGFYELDGWLAKEPLRYKIRKVFGLMPDLQPGLIPEYSNGRSAFPPNGKTYQVEHFMGGIAAYRKDLFDKVKFSHYFEGYGLYEDFDFCVRALPYGKLYVNTNAKVWHYHEPSGRPDFFKYGRMVVRNGWYVWRERIPNPSLKARIEWNAITALQIALRFLNIFTMPERKFSFLEFLGRLSSWVTLLIDKPTIK